MKKCFRIKKVKYFQHHPYSLIFSTAPATNILKHSERTIGRREELLTIL